MPPGADGLIPATGREAAGRGPAWHLQGLPPAGSQLWTPWLKEVQPQAGGQDPGPRARRLAPAFP